jgi:hypothetical protein
MNKLNHKYVSIDTVVARMLRHPLIKDVNYDDLISHAIDVLRLLHVPGQLVENSCYKDVVEYKAALPEESLNLKAVDCIKNKQHIPMLMSRHTAHNHISKMPSGNSNTSEYTYTLNNGMINTNIKSGEIFIIYDAFKTDERGFPMIPDSMALIKAIENYIKVQVFSVLVDLQKISQASLQRAEQEYSWYIGKAQTEFQGFQNDDHVETFLRSFTKMFTDYKAHGSRHKYEVNRELKLPN